ncbi:MAG TPA: DUF378 domain-containing protein [Candidatus Saccharimonadales bacterium]|nr:DUF378 domain-containing protein [Candidatus Saccharimonadales bacterium]
MKMSVMDWIVWVLIFVGALNWGLVGLFKFDLVNSITSGSVTYTGNLTTFGEIVYVVIGLAALWSLVSMFMKSGGGSGNMPS